MSKIPPDFYVVSEKTRIDHTTLHIVGNDECGDLETGSGNDLLKGEMEVVLMSLSW
jgi:hypothetical protein